MTASDQWFRSHPGLDHHPLPEVRFPQELLVFPSDTGHVWMRIGGISFLFASLDEARLALAVLSEQLDYVEGLR